MTDPTRYFIITAGNTGLINKTLEYLNIPHIKYTKILADDLVENDPKYKNRIRKILDEKNENIKEAQFDEAYSNSLNCPTSNHAYSVHCNQNQPNCMEKTVTENKYNCNELNNKRLFNAIKNNENIVFETTGEKTQDWFLQPNTNIIPSHYKIVLSYSIIPLENLIKQNKNKYDETVKKFNINPDNAAPLYRKKSTLSMITGKINKNLEDIITKCFIKKCDLKIDKIIIFDNNGKNITVQSFYEKIIMEQKRKLSPIKTKLKTKTVTKSRTKSKPRTRTVTKPRTRTVTKPRTRTVTKPRTRNSPQSHSVTQKNTEHYSSLKTKSKKQPTPTPGYSKQTKKHTTVNVNVVPQ